MDWHHQMHGTETKPSASQADGKPSDQRARRDGEPGEDEGRGFLDLVRETFIYKMFVSFIEEICPWLSSPETLQNSLRVAKANIRSKPVTTFLYAFLTVSGFLPILCFCLCLCGSFILFGAIFMICHGAVFMFAAVVCAGMFFFTVIMCCVLATLLGMSIHALSLWGWTAEALAHIKPKVTTYLQNLIDRMTTPAIENRE